MGVSRLVLQPHEIPSRSLLHQILLWQQALLCSTIKHSHWSICDDELGPCTLFSLTLFSFLTVVRLQATALLRMSTTTVRVQSQNQGHAPIIMMADMTPPPPPVVIVIIVVIIMDQLPAGRRLGSRLRQLFCLYLSWPPLRDLRTCSAKSSSPCQRLRSCLQERW